MKRLTVFGPRGPLEQHQSNGIFEVDISDILRRHPTATVVVMDTCPALRGHRLWTPIAELWLRDETTVEGMIGSAHA